jgi:hypothetical protein
MSLYLFTFLFYGDSGNLFKSRIEEKGTTQKNVFQMSMLNSPRLANGPPAINYFLTLTLLLY